MFVEVLDRILSETDKPVFISIGHTNYEAWQKSLGTDPNNPESDAVFVNKFLGGTSGVTGIILKWSDLNVSAIKHICIYY